MLGVKGHMKTKSALHTKALNLFQQQLLDDYGAASIAYRMSIELGLREPTRFNDTYSPTHNQLQSQPTLQHFFDDDGVGVVVDGDKSELNLL
jgi:hypothetical protein